MLFYQHRKVWQQRGGSFTEPCHFTSCGQKLQQRSLLRTQSLCDGQHPRDELAAERGLRAQADASPDHRRAQRALGGVVGRLDASDPHKQPERWLDFEQLLTGSSCTS